MPDVGFSSKWATAAEVGSQFVYFQGLESLLRTCHSIVVGPRGSGKTTLLKMLVPGALESWPDNRAGSLIAQRRYYSVFVPADQKWAKDLHQMQALDDPGCSRVRVCFAGHVLRELAATIQKALSQAPGLSGRVEAVVVRSLAKAWGLPGTGETFPGLRAAIGEALLDAVLQRSNPAHAVLNDICSKGLSAAISHAIDIFEAAAGVTETRWCFLMDELEVLPRILVELILSHLRAEDARILWKVALSPYTEEYERLIGNAREGHDFSVVRLWFYTRHDADAFARHIAESMLRQRGYEGGDLVRALGDGGLVRATEQQSAVYRQGSSVQKAFARLDAVDPTFHSYLEYHGIDVSKLDSVSGSQRAANLRKIVSIVVLRDAYRGQGRLRSRKNPLIFTGAGTLLALCDGNPRLLKSVFSPLLDRFKESGRIVDRRLQVRAFREATMRLRAYLKSRPWLGDDGVPVPRGVLGLIDRLGAFVKHSVHKNDFTDQPFGSFIVDSSASDALCQAIGAAVNLAALVYIPDHDSADTLGSVRGKRFRITHAFAWVYAVPMTLMEPKSILAALSPPKQSPPPTVEMRGPSQQTLFPMDS
jgi:hypothetical protein